MPEELQVGVHSLGMGWAGPPLRHPLHEWAEYTVGTEAGSVEEVITWLFEPDSFAPLARLTPSQRLSVVADHLGTPLELVDEQGGVAWGAQLDSYGRIRQGTGRAGLCPFRYQGQYEDSETGLYYNRFRYYSPQEGMYISQDPIGLASGEANLYAYVGNTNYSTDIFGLSEGSKELGDNMMRRRKTHGGQVTAANRGNYRAHHVIPHKVWTDNGDFFRDIGLGDGSVVNRGGKDRASNGVWSPKDAATARSGNFDHYHAGNHSQYSARVRTDVEGIRRQFETGAINAKQARRQIRDLQQREIARWSSRTGATPTVCR